MKKLIASVLLIALLCSLLCSCELVPPITGLCAVKEDHADTNSDGFCDICSADVVITLDIYALNDLHGKLLDTESQSGVDELTSYLRAADARDETHIILSSGDMWQGSAESNITKGLIITDWMNSLGFVSMTLGNHEYDWGEEYIVENADAADFPFLAINVYEKATETPVDYCQPSVVVERGDLKIGIIGAIGDCYSSISSERVEGVYFKVGGELSALVKAEADRLRSEEQVDIVIYSIHDGYGRSTDGDISLPAISGYYAAELSREGYVDIVFEAHTHQKYVLKDSAGVYHLQNGGDNKNGISHVELDVNFVTDAVKVNTAGIVTYSEYSSFSPDGIVEELREKYADKIDEAFGAIGYNSAFRSDDYVEDLTAMLYYETGLERWGDSYDIVLGGGYLKTRSPYDLKSGEVTYSDLMMLMPFDNRLVLCSVKGSDLRIKFLKTTNTDYHIYCGEYGKQVASKINDNSIYYIVVDVYTSQYPSNNLTVVDYYDDYVYARDLLADYIRQGGLE